MQSDCMLCASGKYQTGVGLVAEANCSLCVAGKYHTGSGLTHIVPLNDQNWTLSISSSYQLPV
jgi:hypothetical protein